MLMLIEDIDLQNIAMAHYVRKNRLTDMLLESGSANIKLDFVVNKGQFLRDLLGQARFRELVLTVVDLITDSELPSDDLNQCVCLLDKI